MRKLSDRMPPPKLEGIYDYLVRELVPYVRSLGGGLAPVFPPGAVDEVLSSTGANLLWKLITNVNISAAAAIAVAKLAGGAEGYVLKTVLGIPQWAPFPSGIRTWTGASNTFSAADIDNFLLVSHATTTAAVVPRNISFSFPVATTFYGAQWGAGQIQVTPEAGVPVIRTAETLLTRKQYSPFALVKVAMPDEWFFMGDLQLA